MMIFRRDLDRSRVGLLIATYGVIVYLYRRDSHRRYAVLPMIV